MRSVIASIAFWSFLLMALPSTASQNGGAVEQDAASESSAISRWSGLSPNDFHVLEAEQKARSYFDRKFDASLSAMSVSQDNYDVTYYDLAMRLDDTTLTVYGHVRIVARAVTQVVNEVVLDLWPNRLIDSITTPSGHLDYSRDGDYVTVVLDHDYGTDESFELTVWYYGQNASGRWGALDWHMDETTTICSFSEPYGAPSFWPCKDELTDKADSMGIAIEVDTSLYVASNGTLDSVIANGSNTHTFHYTMHYPIVTYLFSVAISKYTIYEQVYVYNDGLDTMPVIHHVYPELMEEAFYPLSLTPGILHVFSDVFGPYPFLDDKYGHGNTPSGGMEHQTVSSMGEWAITTEEVIIHEAAHQWWGDMITCGSWGDIWINEGLATWSEALYYRETLGEGAYRSYMDAFEYLGTGTVYCDDTTNVSRIFDPNLSYHKGSSVVYMLHYLLGDSLFFGGLSSYYNSQYQYASATTEQFKGVFEDHAQMDLDFFFDQWIYGEGCPNYSYYYECVPIYGGGTDVHVVIDQIQVTDPQVFEMPVEVIVVFDNLQMDTVRVWVDERRDRFKLHFPNSMSGNCLWLDPSNRILSYESRHDWTMFLTTVDEDISPGTEGVPYVDTIQALGGSGEYTILLTGGSLPDGYTIDSEGVISGQTGMPGSYTFEVSVVDNIEGYEDNETYSLYIAPQECCGEFSGGFTGNVNRSTDGKITLSDITGLIDHVYVSKAELECPGDGNTNGSTDGKITLSDITRLIDHVYISKSPTSPCL